MVIFCSRNCPCQKNHGYHGGERRWSRDVTSYGTINSSLSSDFYDFHFLLQELYLASPRMDYPTLSPSVKIVPFVLGDTVNSTNWPRHIIDAPKSR